MNSKNKSSLFEQKITQFNRIITIIINKIIQRFELSYIGLKLFHLLKKNRYNRRTTYFCPYYYYLSTKKLGYLVTHKIASSSILIALLQKDGVFTSDQYPYLLANTKLKKLYKKHPDYYTFTFVRNPFNRLVSFYKNKIIEEAHRKDTWFDIIYFGWLKKSKNFDDFIKRIVLIPDFLQDSHFASLYNALYDERNQECKVDFIGKYENLQEDYKIIQKKFDLPDLSHYPLTASKDKKDWRDYYTLKTAQMVYEKYKKDIIAFGYEKDYQNLIEYIKNKKGDS